MLGSIWNFLKRHKRKFFFTGAVVGGVFAIGKYVQWKVKELQDKETADCLAHARRQHHFDSNQRTCNTTVLSMLPSLREAIMKLLDTEALTCQLKNRPANKLELWEDLKIKSFTRTFVAMYSSCVLVLVLRVRLNIIGGYMYLDNLLNRNGTTKDLAVASQEVQQRYLESIHYILGQGLEDLVAAVTKAVQEVVGCMSLKGPVSICDIENIVRKTRQKLEYWQENGYYDSTTTSLYRFMLPPENTPLMAHYMSRDDQFLDKLAKETQDMIESADFNTVLTLCLDRSFSRLTDTISEQVRRSCGDTSAIPNPVETTLPMAKVIPIINGLIHVILSDVPNEFIQELLLIDQVKNFAANIYEAFSQEDEETARQQVL